MAAQKFRAFVRTIYVFGNFSALMNLRCGGSPATEGGQNREVSSGPIRANWLVMDRPYNIRERTRLFADEVLVFCRQLRAKGPLYEEIVDQLNNAAGSIGANVAEAKDGESKKDFIHKNALALKEANESNYWLKRAWRAEKSLRGQAEPLIQESRELISILTAIVVTAKSNPDRGENVG